MKLTESSSLRIVMMDPASEKEDTGSNHFEKMQALLEKGFTVTRATPKGKTAPTDRSSLLVLGHFDQQSAPKDLYAEDTEIRFEDIRSLELNDMVGLAEGMRQETASYKHGAWKPWFPVIDYDRCTNCMQCLLVRLPFLTTFSIPFRNVNTIVNSDT